MREERSVRGYGVIRVEKGKRENLNKGRRESSKTLRLGEIKRRKKREEAVIG